ncbi:MAG: STAS domain-containing protein [Leptolyngbya sp. SIO3F4]|nr:STAS domain-containing protein [Leptolyngbya sp. SIO3F4]
MNTYSVESTTTTYVPNLVDNMVTPTSHTIICLPKRLDSMISPFFEQDLKQKIRPGATLIIDMSKTKFIDSAAVSVFWKSVLQSRLAGAKIVAKGMNGSTKNLLEQSGLLPHLQ